MMDEIFARLHDSGEPFGSSTQPEVSPGALHELELLQSQLKRADGQAQQSPVNGGCDTMPHKANTGSALTLFNQLEAKMKE